jgi:hypothetical protein
VTIHADGSVGRDEDTVLKPGRPDLFHHRDRNVLRRIDVA